MNGPSSFKEHSIYKFVTPKRSPFTAFIYGVERGEIDVERFLKLESESDGDFFPEIPLLQEWFQVHVLNGKKYNVAPMRGDLIQVSFLDYRNSGLYIVDRSGFVFSVSGLCFDEDDYGSLPPTFTLADFAPDYHQAISHNSIRWVPFDSESDFELEIHYGIPENLFVRNLSNAPVLPRPYMKVDLGNGHVITVVGTSESEGPETHERKHEFLHRFLNHFKGRGVEEMCYPVHAISPCEPWLIPEIPNSVVFIWCE